MHGVNGGKGTATDHGIPIRTSKFSLNGGDLCLT